MYHLIRIQKEWVAAMSEELIKSVPTGLFIGGQWLESSDGGRIDVTDPATEEVITILPPPRLANAGIDDFRPRNTPFTFTFNT